MLELVQIASVCLLYAGLSNPSACLCRYGTMQLPTSFSTPWLGLTLEQNS